VEKYFRARHTTDDNMAYAHCIPMVKYTHSVCMLFLLLCHCNNVCTNAPQCCVICTIRLLFQNIFSFFTAFITSSNDNRGPCEKKSPFNLARENTTTT